MATDAIEREFLSELEELEKFRITYTAQFPNVPLSHDDPDILRLIEAMAFFSARTRVAAVRSLDESVQRIFRQHFPSLLAPTPAMAMLRATATPQFCDSAELPRGSEVSCRLRGTEPDEADKVFRFRTFAALRILPIRLRGVDMAPLRGGGVRLSMRISANSAHNQSLGSLSLYINHLDDLRSSLTVAHELAAHLKSASVVYERDPREDAPGFPCSVEFGSQDAPPQANDAFESPLQRARLRARFPQLELFLRVNGLNAPRNWQHFTLRFELGDTWPRSLRLTTESFELHTVPMLNLQRDLASPIEVDGTKDRYGIRHPDESSGFVPLTVMAAYRPTKEGFIPLEPGVVGIQGDSYEITSDGLGEERRAWLMPHIKSAFASPERISVDAYWHQPALRSVSTADLTVGLHQRYIEGVQWGCSGPIHAYADPVLDGDREAQLQLISTKAKRALDYEDVMFLLRAYGVHLEPHTQKLVSALADVRVSSKPSGRSNLLSYVYELEFGTLDPSDKPRVATFCGWLLNLLSVWSVEEVREVNASVPNLEFTVRKTRG